MKFSSKKNAARIIALALGSTACMTTAQLAWAGEVTGSVSDSTDVRPLPSAQVSIVELDRTTTSARDGSFRFPDVPAGNYTLRISYVGAPVETRSIEVTEDGIINVPVRLGLNQSGEPMEDVLLVIGQYANQASALSRKRAADGVSDVLTRDAIGQFPDQNVAESIRRLPGVNVLNDQGEGRFVSIRGLDPELNSSSLNGVRLPAPESDIRAVALDVISSDVIESIEIKKSLTPDMDGDAIGGSIEIHTTSALDRKNDLFKVKVEGSYNELSGDVSPKAGVDFTRRISDNAGISGGFSWYDRKFATDNVEAEGWDEEGGIIYADTVEYRDYDVERERINASLNFDARLFEDTEIFVRGVYSQFDDQEYRRRLQFEMDADPIAGDDSNASFGNLGKKDEIVVERDLKDRFERQIIRSISAGGKTEAGLWTIDYLGSWSRASETEKGSIDPLTFQRKFEKGDDIGLNFDYSNRHIPAYSITSGADSFIDPSEYEFDKLERTTLSDAEDEEWAFKLDIARLFPFSGGDFTVQAGSKLRFRDKSYNLTLDQFDGFDRNEDLTLAETGLIGDQTYGLADIGPVLDKYSIRDFYRANASLFELDELKTLEESNVEDYRTEEDIYAGYLLGRWDSDNLRIIGGVRMEHTENDISANFVELIPEEEDNAGNVIQEEAVNISPLAFKRSYTDWLPSLTVRFEPAYNLILRAAGYRSLVRPKLSHLAPRVVLEEDEAEFGNPDLEPFTAWNFDAAAEYYYGKNAAISAGFFYKDIKNYTVEFVDNDPGTFNGIAYDEATTYINGDSAEVYGFEASWSQALDFLPDPLDGFLVQLNYTFTHSDATVLEDGELGSPRNIPLPSSSKHTFNVVLGYEKGPFSFRAAGTYRDKYLDEIAGEAEEDRYVADHFQVDLSAKLKVYDGVRLFVEAINITDEPYFAYQNFSGRRLLQYETYDFTLKFGASVKF